MAKNNAASKREVGEFPTRSTLPAIDSEGGAICGEIGYTIIDDVLTLAERLPGIYRRLTT